jgi:hypothetical protein
MLTDMKLLNHRLTDYKARLNMWHHKEGTDEATL